MNKIRIFNTMRILIALFILTLTTLFKVEAHTSIQQIKSEHSINTAFLHIYKSDIVKAHEDILFAKAFKKRGKGIEAFTFSLSSYSNIVSEFTIAYLLPSVNNIFVNHYWKLSDNKAPPTGTK